MAFKALNYVGKKPICKKMWNFLFFLNDQKKKGETYEGESYFGSFRIDNH
jgi:hypothetical protein